jgi:hypothetical protein
MKARVNCYMRNVFRFRSQTSVTIGTDQPKGQS